MNSIQSPPVKWSYVKNYQLKNLKNDFGIPEFQRKTSSGHINRMVTAIIGNQFYDNVIRFYKDKKGKKQLLDGQQRIAALWIAHTRNKLQNYNLLFGEYDEEFGRMVFRKLNMGKPLTTRDHSRALDDHTNSFFNELQPWLAHERTLSKATYVDVLHALSYKNGLVRPVSIKDLDVVVNAITKKDIEVMKTFCEACRIVSPTVFRSMLYKAMIYRNVFKIAYEKALKKDQIVELLKLAITNKKILELSDQERHATQMLVAYKIIHDMLLPKVLSS